MKTKRCYETHKSCNGSTCNQTKKAAFRFEMPNGEQFHIGLHIARLLRSQDLEAWRDKPEEFDAWVKKSVADAISNTTAKLWFPAGGAK